MKSQMEIELPISKDVIKDEPLGIKDLVVYIMNDEGYSKC